MKKAIIITATLLLGTAIQSWCQTSGEADAIRGLISSNNLTGYNSCFPENKQIRGKLSMGYEYYESMCDGHYEKISAIDGDPTDIDTEEEFFLASYLCSGIVNSRPVLAAKMLPKSRESDLKVGEFIYRNIQMATFLGKSNASVYATLFNEFCTNNNISKTEIKNYFERNITTLISDAVDEEFNKISFMIDRNYNAVLTRNPQNGHYKLVYEGVGGVTKELSVASLEALSSAMSKSGDFSATAFNEVRVQSALIPAVVLKREDMQSILNEINNFYLNPSRETFNVLRIRYDDLRTSNRTGEAASSSFFDAVDSLNAGLAKGLLPL